MINAQINKFITESHITMVLRKVTVIFITVVLYCTWVLCRDTSH